VSACTQEGVYVRRREGLGDLEDCFVGEVCEFHNLV